MAYHRAWSSIPTSPRPWWTAPWSTWSSTTRRRRPATWIARSAWDGGSPAVLRPGRGPGPPGRATRPNGSTPRSSTTTPADPIPRVARGFFRLDGDPARCRRDFVDALDLDPHSARARLGGAYLRRGHDPRGPALPGRPGPVRGPRIPDALQLRPPCSAPALGDPGAEADVDCLLRAPTPRRLYNAACAVVLLRAARRPEADRSRPRPAPAGTRLRISPRTPGPRPGPRPPCVSPPVSRAREVEAKGSLHQQGMTRRRLPLSLTHASPRAHSTPVPGSLHRLREASETST